jgi:ABC-2 type transport system ATP-binding protein
VRVAGADPTWVDALGDVRVVEREGDAVSLVLDDHADPQAILDAARAAGRVTEYVEQHPSLTELFRELVG